MVKPKQRENKEFERVKTDDWTFGVIKDVQFEAEHDFPIFKENKETGKYEKVGSNKAEGVRFVFELKDYQFKHYSRWMRLNYGSKSTLYSKYLNELVQDPEPDMDFDTDNLIGMPVKVMWKGEDFQSVEIIRTTGNKAPREEKRGVIVEGDEVPPPGDDDVETVPF